MPPAEPDTFHSFSGTSLGGVRCAQYWVDLITWEGVLNSNRQVRAIVEIGTFEGGFSWYLDMQARAREIEFFTYDSVAPVYTPPGFDQLDVFRYASEFGIHLESLGPIALFCDGGNKPRELATFPPYCHPDSIFAVHDWGTETTADDVPDFLEPIHEDYLERLGSATRWFKKR